MSVEFVTAYILIWPVISAAVMVLLIWALRRDMRAAKRTGESMI